MPSYTLDLPTLLAVFYDQRRTGELRAQDIRFRNRGGLRVRLTFYDGNAVSCVIEEPGGRVFAEGEKARELLSRLGLIEWEWIPQPAPTQQTRLPATIAPRNELEVVFRRSPGFLGDVSVLPRPYQQLVLLVDGQRTVSQIAAFFPNVSVRDVYYGLIELQRRGWLAL